MYTSSKLKHPIGESDTQGTILNSDFSLTVALPEVCCHLSYIRVFGIIAECIRAKH